MLTHSVRTHRSADEFPVAEHLAYKIAQVATDLARRLRKRIDDLDQIATIVLHTSHHTHYVIGTGSGDPQKSSECGAAPQ